MQGAAKPGEPASAGAAPAAETGPIKATLPMWRCSKIMQLQREIHPTVLSSLEGIVDQVTGGLLARFQLCLQNFSLCRQQKL